MSIINKIKTFKDVLEAEGLTEKEFYAGCKGLTEDETGYREVKLITKVLNEGWLPDWENEDQYKYYPYFEIRSDSGFFYSDCVAWSAPTYIGTRMVLKSEELAKYAAKNFIESYRKFMAK